MKRDATEKEIEISYKLSGSAEEKEIMEILQAVIILAQKLVDAPKEIILKGSESELRLMAKISILKDVLEKIQLYQETSRLSGEELFFVYGNSPKENPKNSKEHHEEF